MIQNLLSQKKNIPFRVDRFPFFYGWLILIAGTLGILMSIPGQTMGVSVFTDHLLEALNMERTSLSLAYLIGTLTSGLIITRAGKLYDIYGARAMAMVSGFMLGLMLLGLANIDKLINKFIGLVSFIDVQDVTFAFMVIGFFGIRFFGQGILTMVSRNMVMKWFDKRRGLANGIMGVFVSFGFSYSPRLLNDMIDMMDWRRVWMLLGVCVGLVFIVFAFVFFRDNPQDCGCLPDGGNGSKAKDGDDPAEQRQYTLKEALHTYRFWVFNLNLALNALFVTAITFHIVSIFGEGGMDRDTAVSIFLPVSVIAVSLNFFFGWLSDYIQLKYLLLINQLGIIIASYALLFLGNNSSFAFYLLIIGMGMGSGMFSVLSSVTWPRFFGTRHLGAISGFSMSWIVIGSAFGPFLYSLSLKYSGSYSVSAIICLVMATVLFILGWKANNRG